MNCQHHGWHDPDIALRMARRKSSTLDDAVDLIAMLPWWAGVAIALVSYVLLRGVATAPVAAVASPGQMGEFVASNLYRTFAMIGQYLVPFMALLGALLSFIGRRKRQGLVAKVQAQGNAVDALNGMTWQEFEQLVGEAFRRQGFAVDLVAHRPTVVSTWFCAVRVSTSSCSASNGAPIGSASAWCASCTA
jgi:hypothetical protein